MSVLPTSKLKHPHKPCLRPSKSTKQTHQTLLFHRQVPTPSHSCYQNPLLDSGYIYLCTMATWYHNINICILKCLLPDFKSSRDLSCSFINYISLWLHRYRISIIWLTAVKSKSSQPQPVMTMIWSSSAVSYLGVYFPHRTEIMAPLTDCLFSCWSVFEDPVRHAL